VSYIKEYMLEQEHLSLVRFFHHTVVSHFNNHPHAKRKWCVFTRTSGELLRLSSDEKLRTLLERPTFCEVPNLRLEVIELGNLVSLEKCMEMVEKCFNDGKVISSHMLRVSLYYPI
jgi:hypothetical protein